jgi:hypothetical protein
MTLMTAADGDHERERSSTNVLDSVEAIGSVSYTVFSNKNMPI